MIVSRLLLRHRPAALVRGDVLSSYSRAVTRDPRSNETERYPAVGLNSGLSKADFERKKRTLVMVLDTSGSMSSPFSEYYYDNGEKTRVEDGTTKMQAARESVVALTDHLDDDRFGLGKWEQRSLSLRVSGPFDERIARFERYFRKEMEALGAEGL